MGQGQEIGSGGDCGKLERCILSEGVAASQLQPAVAVRNSGASMARLSGFPNFFFAGGGG